MKVIRAKSVRAQPTSDGGIAIIACHGTGQETALAMTAPQAEAMLTDLLYAAQIAAERDPTAPLGATMRRGSLPLPPLAATTTCDEAGFALTDDQKVVVCQFRFGAVTIPIPVNVAVVPDLVRALSEIARTVRSGTTRTQ